jgi:hypothetical protein
MGTGTYVNVRGERPDGLYSWRQANGVTVWPRSVSCRRGARPLWLVPAGDPFQYGQVRRADRAGERQHEATGMDGIGGGAHYLFVRRTKERKQTTDPACVVA